MKAWCSWLRPRVVARAHQQRMDDGRLRRREPLAQLLDAKIVHQEADGAAVHAVDRLAGAHEPAQRLQHQPVAAQRHDDVGALRLDVAVVLAQPLFGLLGLRERACHKGDPLVARAGAGDRPLEPVLGLGLWLDLGLIGLDRGSGLSASSLRRRDA